MRQVLLRGEEWVSGPLMLTESFADRFRGLRGGLRGHGMLIDTWSVHGFGMKASVWAVGITADFRVLAAKKLAPRRVVGFAGARYVLELPIELEPPPVGSRLTIHG